MKTYRIIWYIALFENRFCLWSTYYFLKIYCHANLKWLEALLRTSTSLLWVILTAYTLLTMLRPMKIGEAMNNCQMWFGTNSYKPYLIVQCLKKHFLIDLYLLLIKLSFLLCLVIMGILTLLFWNFVISLVNTGTVIRLGHYLFQFLYSHFQLYILFEFFFSTYSSLAQYCFASLFFFVLFFQVLTQGVIIFLNVSRMYHTFYELSLFHEFIYLNSFLKFFIFLEFWRFRSCKHSFQVYMKNKLDKNS